VQPDVPHPLTPREARALALALSLAASILQAHEGHDQKLMGTVASVEGVHLQITTTDGQSSMIMLNDKTKVLKGKVSKTPADIKVGDRVVVTTTDIEDKDGKMMLVARQINLGAPAPAAKK
jgi:ribosomal protein S1